MFTKHDLQSQKFKDLKGENRELVLAAAHIEDAKSGRSINHILTDKSPRRLILLKSLVEGTL